VRDEGPGIGVDAQDRIFDKFYRGSGLKAPGSGIGLTIVDLAVQLLNGRLHLESGPGFFTVFDIELPEMQEVNV
jgi:two-component system phosphate regulon sensor histidine kinase PhoR